MDSKEVSKVAYEMVKAYRKHATQGGAIEAVKDKNPQFDLDLLWAMWVVLDAYSDTYGTET